MARPRPLKLHIKDGKQAEFILIGAKGRVLNHLGWNGTELELMPAQSEAPGVTDRNNEKDEKMSESEAVPEVDAEMPDVEPLSNSKEEGNSIPAISEGPSGSAEGSIVDATEDAPVISDETGGQSQEEALAVIDDILDDTSTDKSDSDDDDPPIKVDAGIPGNPKEPVGWLVKGKDKIAIMAEEDQTPDEAIQETQSDHPGYKLHRGPKEPESEEDEEKEESKDDKPSDKGSPDQQ